MADDPVKPEAKSVPEVSLTVGESGGKSAGQTVAAHLDEHKAKYIAGIIVSVLLGLLQAWPSVCPNMPGILSCAKSQGAVNVAVPLLKIEQGKLDSAGGGNE